MCRATCNSLKSLPKSSRSLSFNWIHNWKIISHSGQTWKQSPKTHCTYDAIPHILDWNATESTKQRNAHETSLTFKNELQHQLFVQDCSFLNSPQPQPQLLRFLGSRVSSGFFTSSPKLTQEKVGVIFHTHQQQFSWQIKIHFWRNIYRPCAIFWSLFFTLIPLSAWQESKDKTRILLVKKIAQRNKVAVIPGISSILQ